MAGSADVMNPATRRPLPEWLVVHGAAEHNLAGVTVRIPHRALVVMTGLSGSGKSTLAFDTIYAECRRLQVQSMSAFARQFLGEPDRPEVDSIEGLCSAIALDQRTASTNPRSTVATATDVYDLLRVLYARTGTPHCTECGKALRHGRCREGHDGPVAELTPRAFSFNLPHGACPRCQGVGSRLVVDTDLVVPDPGLSLAGHALAPWRPPSAKDEFALVLAMADRLGVDPGTPWRALPSQVRETFLDGPREPVAPLAGNASGPKTRKQLFHGVIPWLERQHQGGGKSRAAAYLRRRPCPDCDGTRLNPAQRGVRIGGRHGIGIGDLCLRSVRDCLAFFRGLELAETHRAVAVQPVAEVITRLEHLVEVGLEHLTLDRAAPTLSGGEAQRLRLAQQLGTGLFGLLYVLDEPTAGLHPADVDSLLGSLAKLRDQGNSLLVVEHDDRVTRAADWVVDLGPGAGRHGGQVLYSGPLDGLLADEESATGAHLSGRRSAVVPGAGDVAADGPRLVVRGAAEHNLDGVDAVFPVGRVTAIAGVSGSGKSTLADQVLYRAVARAVQDEPVVPGAHRAIDGLDHVDRAVRVDQAPIGRTPRSNPATYTGAFDGIRALFAATDEAKSRGFGAGRFSFNTAGGRCEICGGDGTTRIDMRFLPDVFVPCDECHGTRYNAETLEVRYHELTIAEVLEMPVSAALRFFEGKETVVRPLRALEDVGLGYVTLGQPAPTLSGGEAQRVKLATELSGRGNGKTLYVLDEPTTGLHPEDVRRLLGVIRGLAERGNTVVVVEHDLAVIASADWVLELGPGGGEAGGRLVVAGSPAEVAAHEDSVTGPYLRDVLSRAAG